MGHIFYGWKITGASFVILFVAVGVGLYVPPVFLVPIEEHFGWSRAAISGGSAVAALTSGLMSPLAGMWIDRYGSRRVMITGSLAMAFALFLVSRMTALWQLYTFTALAGAGLTCVAWVPNQTLIANWFTRKRGLAMGIALMGIGFGGLAMSPLAAALIDGLGWRRAYVVLASIVGIVLTAVIAAVVRDRPADLGLLPDGATGDTAGADSGETALETGDTGLQLGDSLRTAAFWLLSACHFLWVFSNMSMIQHLVAYLQGSGFAHAAAAATLGTMVGVSVLGRVIFGYFADRVPKRHLMSVALMMHALATVCMLRVGAPGAVVAFTLLFGLGLGGAAVLVPLLVGECFGLIAFGKVLGLIMISATAGAATGPVLTGRIYDTSGSYHTAWILHATIFTAAALLVQWLRRPTVRHVAT